MMAKKLKNAKPAFDPAMKVRVGKVKAKPIAKNKPVYGKSIKK